MTTQSYITNDKIHLRLAVLDDDLKLHPGQLVSDVLEIMMINEKDMLSIYENGQCVGILYLQDLIQYILTARYRQSLLFYRLNFDLRCATLAIMGWSRRAKF